MLEKKAASEKSKKATSKTKKKTKDMADEQKQKSTEEEMESVLQRKVLMEWEAPARPYRKLDKEVFSTVLAGAFLLGVILFFIDGAMPVVALASLVFLYYVLGTVPPGKVKHVITNWGIESEDKVWPWELMMRFWLQGEGKNTMMVVELGPGTSMWSRHLRFMLGDLRDSKSNGEEELRKLMQQYVIEDQPKPNWLDKVTKWAESKVKLAPGKSLN